MKKSLLILMIFLILLMFGCQKDELPPTVIAENITINNSDIVNPQMLMEVTDNLDKVEQLKFDFIITDEDEQVIEQIDQRGGIYQISFVVTDRAGNKTEGSFVVTVLDVIPPVLTANVDYIQGPLTSNMDFESYYTCFDETVGDYCIFHSVVLFENADSSVFPFTETPGEYILKFFVSDLSNNKASIEIPLIIE